MTHPPCRLWGKLRHFSTAPAKEKELAIWAIRKIRECGGVLEHPEGSMLWPTMQLPKPGKGRDEFGGWSMGCDQFWFGHKARKRTMLYIYGVSPKRIPVIPFRMGYPDYVIASSKKHTRGRKHLSKKERKATPVKFAEWLIETARRTQL